MTETVVLKFGGSSVGSPDRIRRVAKIVASHRQACERVVVVVSAMGDTTDELIELAKKVSPRAEELAHRREMDMLLSTGERISMALLSMALGDVGVAAISLTGSQSGILTTDAFGEACIQDIKPIRIVESLRQKKVVIVAGFQGVSVQKEITTLGRGGSDTTATALAIALGAKECIIYTDVDGYFSADPRKVPTARKLAALPWQLAIEGAARGAQILHPRCVELAWKFAMPLRVCTSLLSDPDRAQANIQGTRIEGNVDSHLESSRIYSVSLQKKLSRIEVSGFADAAQAAEFFAQFSARGFRHLAWAYQRPTLRMLVESGHRHFLNDVPNLQEHSGLSRLSLIGSGLSHQSACFTDVVVRLKRQGAQILESHLSNTAVDVVFVLDDARAEVALAEIHAHWVGA